MAKKVLIDTNSYDVYVKEVLATQRQALMESHLDMAAILGITFYTAGALEHLRELIYGEEEK